MNARAHKASAAGKLSTLERALLSQLLALRVAIPVQEYRFAAVEVGLGPGVRQRLVLAGMSDWRFDFAWPEYRFAAEVEGGTWLADKRGQTGRHQTGRGFENDCQKYHHALRLGWTVYRCDGKLVHTWDAAELIQRIVTLRTGNHEQREPEGARA